MDLWQQGQDIHAQYMAELYDLQAKHWDACAPILEKRGKIISGEDDGGQGLRDFWLLAMQAHEDVKRCIEEWDEPVLRYVADINVAFTHEQQGFRIDFIFDENPFFTNVALAQRFFIDVDGQLRPGQGTAIDWRLGQNVTLCTLAKHEVSGDAHRHQQQHKRRNHHHFAGSKDAIRQRSGTKVVARDSFFHFFGEGGAGGAGVRVSVGEEEEAGAVMDEDGQVQTGLALKDEVIPFAVKYYTGEVNHDDDEDSGGWEDEDEDDDDGGGDGDDDDDDDDD